MCRTVLLWFPVKQFVARTAFVVSFKVQVVDLLGKADAGGRKPSRDLLLPTSLSQAKVFELSRSTHLL